MSLRVIVPTKKALKVEGILKAFREIFQKEEIIILAEEDVSSGVQRQPYGNLVFLGAQNRLESVKKITRSYDYVVSCESGLIEQFGRWFNFQVVIIEDNDGNRATGISPGYEIPEKYVEKVLDSSIRVVMDEVFGKENASDYIPGAVSTRTELIEQATKMAISGLRWR